VRATGDAPPITLGQVNDDSLTQPDEWFTVEMIAVDNRFTTKINGLEVATCNDPLSKHATGHLALQVWNPNTLVQFRKIEIKELPASIPQGAEQLKRRFTSDEWIEVIPLIAPRTDKWDIYQQTGKNAWKIEQSNLVIGGDSLGSKLLLPLDSDWPAFECEIDFTRRAGNSGFNLNLPTKLGECPLVVDAPGYGGGVYLGSRAKGVLLTTGAQIVTGHRATLHVEVGRQQDTDHVSVAIDGMQVGQWSGDSNAMSNTSKESFPHHRRVSLWINPGGNEFVFHRIRVRMLDGGTAESLRPVPSNPPVPEGKQDAPPAPASGCTDLSG